MYVSCPNRWSRHRELSEALWGSAADRVLQTKGWSFRKSKHDVSLMDSVFQSRPSRWNLLGFYSRQQADRHVSARPRGRLSETEWTDEVSCRRGMAERDGGDRKKSMFLKGKTAAKKRSDPRLVKLGWKNSFVLTSIGCRTSYIFDPTTKMCHTNTELFTVLITYRVHERN